ncbi:MAG: phenylacetate--CoA ligase [Candidatus Parcubacteria bacterium]|nr:MAG: phenylacetate--CoA ligase [Candidatus Parcubacteria bacterium]
MNVPKNFRKYKLFINKVISDIKTKKTEYWIKTKEKFILNLFYNAARKVPAYKDFLKKNKINPEKIKTLEDFKLIPPINKENYILYYDYEKLLWDGSLKKPLTIHASSGTTGEPTYFFREPRFDLIREISSELFLSYRPSFLTQPTLFINTFGMGVWSAGVGMLLGCYLGNLVGNTNLSIISPGVNKIEVIKIFKNIASLYKQIVITGYPPFVKDIIDELIYEGINIKKFNLRFILIGEPFPDELKNYLKENAGLKNIFLDIMNAYGTSEFGATAFETPLSGLIKHLCLKNKIIFKEIFGDITKTPTLAQFIPYFVNFEEENGELILTGDNAIPLIRYQIGDKGGVFNYYSLIEFFENKKIKILKLAKKFKIDKTISELPFVYVYERKNLATTFYAILIFPEFIKSALLDKDLSKFLTGKFTMITKYDKNQNQYLEINLELKKGFVFKKYYEKIALKKIVETLRKKSSEYRELSNNLKERAYPKLVFWQYEHQKFFKPGGKHKWVLKNAKN